MSKSMLLAALLLSTPVVASCSNAHAVAMDPDEGNDTPAAWQQSTDVRAVLTVRDKNGSMKQYKAVFIVTDPKGGQSRKEVTCQDDDACEAVYPNDFQWSGYGVFTWRALVAGTDAGSGRFEFRQDSVKLLHSR